MSKVTILLGAGASLPFIKKDNVYLSTEILTQAIFNKDRWRNIIKRFCEYKSQDTDAHMYLDNIGENDIFFILDKVQQYDNTVTAKLNFEQIIHLMERMSIYLSQHDNSIDSILINLIYEKKREYSIKGWHYIPFLARELIISVVLEFWNQLDASNILKINKTFFTQLLNRFESVNIYSLNYDPLIYESLNDSFKTGFENTNEFDLKNFYFAKNIIAFLHGHVGFRPYSKHMQIGTDYLKIQEERIKKVFDTTQNQTYYFDIGMKGTHYNTYLITGLDKVDTFSKNPFAIYIQRFAKDIIESDYIMLVGTSLNDYHLYAPLVNALHLGREEKKIIFVTKANGDEIYERFFYNGNNIFLQLLKLLGDSISINWNSPNKSVEKFLKKHADELIKNGYSKISNHILLYVNGTEHFYQEKEIQNII